MRVATPDLEYFIRLYGNNVGAAQELFLHEYVRFNSEKWSGDLTHVRNNHAVFVLNHNFRAWGHQFIYDLPALTELLEIVGFTQMQRQLPSVSKDKILCNLEFRKEIVGIADALIVEGQKPHAREESHD